MLVKLKDIADIIAGQSPESRYYSDNKTDIPFLQGNRTFGIKYPTIDTYTSKVTKMAQKGDVLISVRAPVGDLNIANMDLCIGRGLASMKAKDGDNEFLYYALKANMNNIVNKGNGTTYDSITADVIKNAEISIPDDQNIRKRVSYILSSFDNQIERNNRMVQSLQVLGKSVYCKNKNDNTFCLLKDISEISTGREDANHATANGKFKFFTCSEEALLCDDYKFDGKYILVAGNGNFNVKFYDGKFNAYQRTYTIKNDTIFGDLYYTLFYNTDSFKKQSNGSIIKFITIDMLNRIRVPIFSDKTNKVLNNIVNEIASIENGSEKLHLLKNQLLPLLINGQLS